ncbi:MAG: hypothetical protein KC593_12600 [Myxococcales bacterium]|nr:hypothetical protein [Myxococcales bacterium]
MTGAEYSNLIASYLVSNFADRGLSIFREVGFGQSIIGKKRRLDILAVHDPSQRVLAIECKYQGSQGTVDEKIPYTLQDMEAVRVPSLVVYAGDGFSAGVVHLLAASPLAAYALPQLPDLQPNEATRELDHIVAMTFDWWDVLLQGKSKFVLST